ncbi:MAG: TolC family protein [Candidatus Sericytochromatia bacterium]|nr:TolC family protein [Candidatus Sericytochromatia bacterium]
MSRWCLAWLALLLAAGPAWAAQGLSLTEAIREGLGADATLRQAELELARNVVGVEGARAEQLQYGADLSVGNWTGVTGLLSAGPVQPISVPIANAQVMARWPLFTGFRLDRQIDAAEAGVLAARARLDKAHQDVIFAVTEAYWTTRRAELKSETQREGVRRAREAWAIAREVARAGQASAQEVEQAELSTLAAEGEALRLEGDALQARERLATLLRRDLSRVALRDEPAREVGKDPGGALEGSLEARPDVRLARAEVAIRGAGVGVAAADSWPQLEVASLYQHGNNPFFATSQNRTVLDRLVGTWNAQLNLSYHLFDHGVIARNIRGRSLEQAASEQALAATLAAAEAEVRATRRRLALTVRRIELGRRGEDLARRNLDWQRGRYRQGRARLSDLNEARTGLIERRHQRLDAEIDHRIAVAALQRALGTLDVQPGRPEEARP